MPKEQGHFGERVTRNTSKNAKNKSNSATLRASQGLAHKESGLGDVSNHMLRCDSEKDSEKDSGYSEAGSDSLHTDVDDQHSSVSKPHRQSSKSSSNNNTVNATGRNMPPYEELTPIYVIKNLVVKSSRPEHLLHGSLAWSRGWHSLTSDKLPTQLLLIQQPAIPASSSSTPTSSSGLTAPQSQVTKGGSHSNHNSSKNSYLPILKSYPRIAPHPRKESHEGKAAKWVEGVKESGSEGQSQSKRVRTEEEKREAVSTTSLHLNPQQQQHQQGGRVHPQSQCKGRGGHSSFPGTSHCQLPNSTTHPKSHRIQQSSGCDSVSSPSISSSQTCSPPSSSDSPASSSPPSSAPSSAAHRPYCLALDSLSTRQRRFLSTTDILNQSGLLAIKLRVNELLKQNAATEREITQLRQHTHLLCQAAQASQNGCSEDSNGFGKLLQSMTESCSYPNLDFNQLKELSCSHQQSKTRGEEVKEKENNTKTNKTHSNVPQSLVYSIEDVISPPSPLFAPSPETEKTENADGPVDSPSLSVYLSRSVSEQEHRQAVTDKDFHDLMLPEDSLHSTYLL